MVFILYITFSKCQDTQTLFGIYLVLTYMERLSTITHKIFETYSGFHVKYRTTGKV